MLYQLCFFVCFVSFHFGLLVVVVCIMLCWFVLLCFFWQLSMAARMIPAPNGAQALRFDLAQPFHHCVTKNLKNMSNQTIPNKIQHEDWQSTIARLKYIIQRQTPFPGTDDSQADAPRHMFYILVQRLMPVIKQTVAAGRQW